MLHLLSYNLHSIYYICYLHDISTKSTIYIISTIYLRSLPAPVLSWASCEVTATTSSLGTTAATTTDTMATATTTHRCCQDSDEGDDNIVHADPPTPPQPPGEQPPRRSEGGGELLRAGAVQEPSRPCQ